MSIILTKPIRVGGVELVAGTTQTFGVDLEAGLVAEGKATYVAGFSLDSPPPKILKFPDFFPSILASLVTGATYGQSGNTVTVAAPAHGLPNNRDGYRIFWPGSAAIAAGWYFGFAYVDANSYTFQNPTAQTVTAGTAITGTLPWVTSTTMFTMTLPGGSMQMGSEARFHVTRGGDATSATKIIRCYIDEQNVGTTALTTVSSIRNSTSFNVINSATMSEIVAADYTQIAGTTMVAKDFTADRILSVRAQLGAAAAYLTVENSYVELIK